MAAKKKTKPESETVVEPFEDLPSLDEIEHRTKYAICLKEELKVRKDTVDFEAKCDNLCRIDSALGEFDEFLKDFVAFLRSVPDKTQDIVPGLTPKQYRELQDLIDVQLSRLGDKRLHLQLESTRQQTEAERLRREESTAKTAARRRGDA